MRTVCTVFVLACAVVCVYAAAAIYPPQEKPAEFASEEGCYLDSLKRVLAYEVPYYPEGKCEEFTCRRDNYTYYVSCGVIGVQPGCRVVRDLTQKYPNCCGKVVCDPTTTTTTAAITTESTTTIEAATSTEASITEAPSCGDE